MEFFYAPLDPGTTKKERVKARELRASQWWRQQLGNGLCHYCEKRFEKAFLTMDHLIPIARGGKTNKKNVVVSCKDCNSKKGRKTLAELSFEELESSRAGQV